MLSSQATKPGARPLRHAAPQEHAGHLQPHKTQRDDAGDEWKSVQITMDGWEQPSPTSGEQQRGFAAPEHLSSARPLSHSWKWSPCDISADTHLSGKAGQHPSACLTLIIPGRISVLHEVSESRQRDDGLAGYKARCNKEAAAF